MALPKRKHSKGRRDRRRNHDALVLPSIPKMQKTRAEATRSKKFFCSNCNQPKPPHAACPNCGYYRGRAVIEVER